LSSEHCRPQPVNAYGGESSARNGIAGRVSLRALVGSTDAPFEVCSLLGTILSACVRFVASSRPVMRYAKEASDITRCSTIGRLPGRASPATVRSEARGTTYPRSSDRPWEREPTRRLPASRRSGASRPGQVNPGEVLIKAVNRGKPKMLSGLDQKV